MATKKTKKKTKKRPAGRSCSRGNAAQKRACRRRVSACISKKIRGEGWKQPRAVAACLNMERAGRLTATGLYQPKGRKKRPKGRRAGASGEVVDCGCDEG